MSCIFRNEDGEIILMCKGADSVIEERLSQKSKGSDMFKKTKIIVDGFANQGLRTLYLAERKIDEIEYDEWNSKV
jgi:magnesium-transporting ATPase (P-type)